MKYLVYCTVFLRALCSLFLFFFSRENSKNHGENARKQYSPILVPVWFGHQILTIAAPIDERLQHLGLDFLPLSAIDVHHQSSSGAAGIFCVSPAERSSSKVQRRKQSKWENYKQFTHELTSSSLSIFESVQEEAVQGSEAETLGKVGG